jgi:hypothetical protein
MALLVPQRQFIARLALLYIVTANSTLWVKAGSRRIAVLHLPDEARLDPPSRRYGEAGRARRLQRGIRSIVTAKDLGGLFELRTAR